MTMIATVPVATLKKALTIIKPSLPKRPVAPFDCVQIAAIEGSITVTATDGDQGCAHSIPANIRVPGVTLVDFKALSSVLALKSLASETITINVPGPGHGTLEILPGSSTLGAVMPCIDCDNFPLIPKARKNSAAFPVSHRQLNLVLAAAATDAARAALCGVFLDGDGTMVASDSYRMHVISCATAYPKVTMHQITAKQIVKAGADVVMRVLQDEPTGDVLIFQTESLSEAATRWWCRPVNGFPNYKEHVAADATRAHSVIVDRNSLISAVEFSSSVFTKDDNQVLRLTLVAGRLLVESMLSDERSSAAHVDAVYTQPEGLVAGFTAPYLRDILAVGKPGNVRIEYDTPGKPFYFFDDPKQGDNLVRVLMPVSLL